MTLTMSPMGVRFLASWESCVLHPYYDEDGYPTIGYGHLLSTVQHDPLTLWPSISQGTALDLLTEDLLHTNEGVENLLVAQGATTGQQQFDALVSFAYNCGLSALKTSTLLRRHVAKASNAEIMAAFLMWDKEMGTDGVLVASPGLERRRMAEANIYMYGRYRGADDAVV